MLWFSLRLFPNNNCGDADEITEGATQTDPGKNAPAMSEIIGSFAEQGINVVVMMVSFCLLRFR